MILVLPLFIWSKMKFVDRKIHKCTAMKLQVEENCKEHQYLRLRFELVDVLYLLEGHSLIAFV